MVDVRMCIQQINRLQFMLSDKPGDLILFGFIGTSGIDDGAFPGLVPQYKGVHLEWIKSKLLDLYHLTLFSFVLLFDNSVSLCEKNKAAKINKAISSSMILNQGSTSYYNRNGWHNFCR